MWPKDRKWSKGRLLGKCNEAWDERSEGDRKTQAALGGATGQ
jgi:hypothetical protein